MEPSALSRRSFLAALPALAAWQPEEPFFFIQATDPQFGMYEGNKGFEQETANFEFLAATVNRLRPAFLVVCGDLVNRPGHPAQVSEYLRIAAKIRAPLYNVAGNHDVGNEPTAAVLAEYRRRFGPDYYTFRAGPMTAFVLNSVIIHSPKNVPDELAKQEAWLKAELEKARQGGARRIVVFQHHPPFLKDPDEPDRYEVIPRARRRIYLDLFRSYGVSHVFAGHYHRNAAARYGEIEIVVTGPAGKPLGPDPSGFRVVIVRSGGIEHQYYGLGNIPNKIQY